MSYCTLLHKKVLIFRSHSMPGGGFQGGFCF
ncbi:MAG TPA: hypothetical protein GXX41_13425 [Thermoanaerobacterium sp.]|nr:hypothetical protein [Thermoanaerobacterium sp.]